MQIVILNGSPAEVKETFSDTPEEIPDLPKEGLLKIKFVNKIMDAVDEFQETLKESPDIEMNKLKFINTILNATDEFIKETNQ